MQLRQYLDPRNKFEIELDIKAPNIILPEDLTDHACPALVLVLGTLSVRTEQTQTPASRQSDCETEMEGDDKSFL